MIYDALVLPFIEFAFMQRAVSGALMLSLSAAFAENISDARLVEQITSEAGLELGERSIRMRCLQPTAPRRAIST